MSHSFAAQSRINFDPHKYRQVGITDIFVTPFQVNSESFQDVETFKENLHTIKQKADEIGRAWPEARVIINMFTICHPEGNFRVPDRFRPQIDLRGNIRPGFVCFLDERRQSELLEMYRLIAEAGFEHVMIDDDFRDAFCFCEEHLARFGPFGAMTREEVAAVLNNPDPSPEDIRKRRGWLDFKREGLFTFARKIERTLHSINPKLRIGICISAKRCNDLSGRTVKDWLAIFNTPEAPVFVRLAGEHYTDLSLGISQSVGWHQYYRDLLGGDMEMMAEVTYVHPICFKSPASIRLETKIHLAGGLEKVLLAWVEDYKYNGGWRMLSEEQESFRAISEISRGVRGSVGIAIYAPEDCAEFTPVDQVGEVDPIRAYQAFAMMGFPVRMPEKLDESSRVTVLTGYLPDWIGPDVKDYLDGGGILIVDGLAAHSFAMIMPVEFVRFSVSGNVSGLRAEEVIHSGDVMDELGGFPHDSVYRLEPARADSSVRVMSEIYDVDGERRGVGILIYPAGGGWIIVLAYDLCGVNYRLASDGYRRLLTHLFDETGYKPEVQLLGDLFVQPLLHESPRRRLVLVNYSSYEGEVSCRGHWIGDAPLKDAVTGEILRASSIRIPSLGVRVAEVE